MRRKRRKSFRRMFYSPVVSAMVGQVLQSITLPEDVVKERTVRLNKVLAGFSMAVREIYSRYGFSSWTVIKKPAIAFLAATDLFDTEMGSVSDDLLTFSIDPDGPVSEKLAERIAEAIAAEFSVPTSAAKQAIYQGGL